MADADGAWKKVLRAQTNRATHEEDLITEDGSACQPDELAFKMTVLATTISMSGVLGHADLVSGGQGNRHPGIQSPHQVRGSLQPNLRM